MGWMERPILLRCPNGRTEQIDTFMRNANVMTNERRWLRWLVVTKWYLYVFRFVSAFAAILSFAGFNVPNDQPRYILAAI